MATIFSLGASSVDSSCGSSTGARRKGLPDLDQVVAGYKAGRIGAADLKRILAEAFGTQVWTAVTSHIIIGAMYDAYVRCAALETRQAFDVLFSTFVLSLKKALDSFTVGLVELLLKRCVISCMQV